MMFHSIRLRLTVWYSAVLLAALLLFGVSLWLLARHYLVAELDRRLAHGAQGIGAVIAHEVGQSDFLEEVREYARAAPGPLLRLRDAGGAELLPDSPLRSVTPGALENGTAILNGDRYRVHSERLDVKGQAFEVISGAPLSDDERMMAQLRTILLVAIPFVVLVAFAAGYWISRRALAPVDELTNAARRISVENLSDRLTAPKTGDELQRLAETWNQMLARLESSVRRIASFTSDASHELRTPLSVITTTAELALRRERDVEQYRRALADILSEARRMSALAADLLDLARSDAGHAALPLEPVEIDALAREVAAEMASAAGSGSVTLVAEGDPVTAPVNRAALRRLLLILIDNALKHTPAGGSITIHAGADPGGVMLSVTDTGEGIAAADAPHVFDRFYRADKARNHRNGVGLGLSIAQTIAQMHGAQIQLESTPGRGSRFFLTIPTGLLSANLHVKDIN